MFSKQDDILTEHMHSSRACVYTSPPKGLPVLLSANWQASVAAESQVQSGYMIVDMFVDKWFVFT